MAAQMVRLSQLLSIGLLIWRAVAILDFEVDFGGIANVRSGEACGHNTRLLNDVLRRNVSRLEALRIVGWNRTMHFYPGIIARGLEDVRLIVDGTMRFQRPHENYSSPSGGSHPSADGTPPACWLLSESNGVIISTSEQSMHAMENGKRGLIDGLGSHYWGVPYIGYLKMKGNRPILIHLRNSTNVLIQHMILRDCPIECLVLDEVKNALVRKSSIVSRRTKHRAHGFLDLSAFGTKGVTITASNHVSVDSVDVWTQDECISIHDGSENIILDGVNASCLGITVASAGGSVTNVSVYNTKFYRSVKGIQLKFYPSKAADVAGSIENIHIENITMESTTQWPLWFGPAQQASDEDACQPNPCSVCWPQTSGSTCNVVPRSNMRNITLRHVLINNPRLANGVLLSDTHSAVLDHVVFENVRVTKGDQLSFANKDLTKTFPGLKQPVQDAYLDNRKHVVSLEYEPDDSTNAAAKEQLHAYHGYELPSQEFLGMKITARIGIIVGTCLCAVSLVILLALCIRLQCREDDNTGEDGSIVQDSSDSHHDYAISRIEGEDESDSSGPAEVHTDSNVADNSGRAANKAQLQEPLLPNSPPITPRHSRLTRISRSCHISPYHVIALLAAVYGFLVGLSYMVKVPGKPEWLNTNQYYVCEGVTNGVATGNTWPVPYCFENDTRWFSWTQVYDHISSLLHAHFVLSACILTCVSLYIHFSFLFKERTTRNVLASFGDQII